MNVGLNILDANGELSEKPCIHNENVCFLLCKLVCKLVYECMFSAM